MRRFDSLPWERSSGEPWQRSRNGVHPIAPPLPAPVRTRPRYVIHAGLFLLTVATTVAAGMLWEGLDPLTQPALFYRGLPYAGTLLTILFCHEMGHYLTARYYGMDVTLPYFLPAPPVPFILGTFGAFIRMQSPPPHRRALLYVGAAGPIAGFCVALPAMIYAYTTSTVTPIPTAGTGLYFGEPLLLQLIGRLVIGPLPEGAVLTLNSVGLAAWFGLLVTMFNLLPIGQLDGGHIVYALLGRATRYLSWLLIGTLLVLGWYAWPGWYFWALVGWLTGRRHPTILDQHAPLTRRSQIIAGIALVIFIACFMPVPVDIIGF